MTESHTALKPQFMYIEQVTWVLKEPNDLLLLGAKKPLQIICLLSISIELAGKLYEQNS